MVDIHPMQTTSDMLRSDIDHVVPEELHAIYREESEDHIGSIYSGLNELQLEWIWENICVAKLADMADGPFYFIL